MGSTPTFGITWKRAYDVPSSTRRGSDALSLLRVAVLVTGSAISNLYFICKCRAKTPSPGTCMIVAKIDERNDEPAGLLLAAALERPDLLLMLLNAFFTNTINNALASDVVGSTKACPFEGQRMSVASCEGIGDDLLKRRL